MQIGWRVCVGFALGGSNNSKNFLAINRKIKINNEIYSLPDI